MFSAIYRYIIIKTGQYVKELSLSFLEMKIELKNFYWFVFFILLFRLIVERLRIFRPHCNISANTQDYELKINKQIFTPSRIGYHGNEE